MTTLSKAMLRELHSIERRGEPSDPYDWHAAGPLWFHARDKVLGALLRRGLIEDKGDYQLTDAGKEAVSMAGIDRALRSFGYERS